MKAHLDAAFSRLTELEAESDSFEEILRIIKEITKVARLPEGSIRSGKMVYRARVNEKDKSFCNRDEISYIKDLTSITRYGRANRPGRSLFWCSDDVMTAFVETADSKLRDNSTEAGSVTIGCWRVVRPAENVALVLNSSDTLSRLFPAESEAAKAVRFLVDNKDRWEVERWRKALDYLVARFTERVTNHLQYQITSAIFDALIGDSPVGGIAYPSVSSEALGINYALLPDTINRRLKLVDVVRLDFRKQGTSVEIRERASDHFGRNGGVSFRS